MSATGGILWLKYSFLHPAFVWNFFSAERGTEYAEQEMAELW